MRYNVIWTAAFGGWGCNIIWTRMFERGATLLGGFISKALQNLCYNPLVIVTIKKKHCFYYYCYCCCYYYCIMK